MDVFRGDIIKSYGHYFVVMDSMQNNNGNFRARDKRNRLQWFNTVTDDFEVVQRPINYVSFDNQY